jgi:ribosome-associated protein
LLKALAANLAPAPPKAAAEHLACLCARVADENKARGVMVLDMRGITTIYDYFVIATGVSRRQTHTIADEIEDAMAAEGEERLGIEGYEPGKWIVLDYGDVLIHIFDPICREYYGLEHLWADAPQIDWRRE